MADVTVRVFKDSDGEYRVFPPVAVLRLKDPANNNNPDDFCVINYTDDDLAWSAPQYAFDPTDSYAEIVKKGKPPQKSAKSPHKAGAYAYSVTLLRHGKKAKGNSDPMIIVEA